MSAAKHYGVTRPMDFDAPSDSELALSQSLDSLLKMNDCYETSAGVETRRRVLIRLSELFKNWVRSEARAKNELHESQVERVSAHLYTYGSYRLDVNAKDADIDALAVAPKCIERSDFFTSFLRVLQNNTSVTNLVAVESAYVPIIKLQFDGIPIDLIFARLNTLTVTAATDLSQTALLKNLDVRCVKSLNGARVTNSILALVPNETAFKVTLRAVKFWAKRRGLYSNAFGYLGGVAYAMLVVRTCQLYPTAAPARLLQKFFFVASSWQWPSPVHLKPVEDAQLNFPVWDPEVNPADKQHLMPIITPAYPHMNSTHNVMMSTRTLITREFAKALKTVTHIIDSYKVRAEDLCATEHDASATERDASATGRDTCATERDVSAVKRDEVGQVCNRVDNPWLELFRTVTFFSDYKHFITVGICSEPGELYTSWESLVESKIRLLAAAIERNTGVELVVPFAHSFAIRDATLFFQDALGRSSLVETSGESLQTSADVSIDPNLSTLNAPLPGELASRQWFVAFRVQKQSGGALDLSVAITEFQLLIDRARARLAPQSESATLALKMHYVKSRDLNKFVCDDDLRQFTRPPVERTNATAPPKLHCAEAPQSSKRPKTDAPQQINGAPPNGDVGSVEAKRLALNCAATCSNVPEV